MGVVMRSKMWGPQSVPLRESNGGFYSSCTTTDLFRSDGVTDTTSSTTGYEQRAASLMPMARWTCLGLRHQRIGPPMTMPWQATPTWWRAVWRWPRSTTVRSLVFHRLVGQSPDRFGCGIGWNGPVADGRWSDECRDGITTPEFGQSHVRIWARWMPSIWTEADRRPCGWTIAGSMGWSTSL